MRWPVSGLRLPRPTIRLRLTLLYGALFLVSGAALLAGTFVLVNRATADPLVYRDPSGQLTVEFAGEPPPQTSGAQPSPTIETDGTGGGGPAPEADVEALQALAERQHAAQMNQLLTWSGVVLAGMAVASIGIGWLVAGRVLDPLRRMSAGVHQITTTNLGQRLGLDGPDDELKDLAWTFNDLLARLERAFEAQRQFVANASHELRTPLARQRTLIQVALADPDASAGPLRHAFERVLAAGAQQEELIEALLTLARGEQGIGRRESLDLAWITSRVLDARRADVERRGLRLVTRLDSAPTAGDPRLLDRLVGNLVDNASRYNDPHGRIEVTTAAAESAAVLRISNDGPAVSVDVVSTLFEPFERLGRERLGHGDGEGWGLGLSIVRAIAQAHDGHVDATARPEGGLTVEVRLPAVRVPAGPPHD